MPGARLYRTGDLCRLLPSSEIEFLGRIDHQVKVRGFRIELGEVEAVLRDHPRVREALVMVREGGAGPMLVAYLEAVAGAAPEVAGLRAFLRERLPDYMLPAAFVVLPALPLLPNGKVNRSALPAPAEGRLAPGAAYVEPATAVERRLAAIWASLLGTERVGVQDDFFELGGHSLLAAQVLFRIQEELAVEIPMQRLFETPTVAGLASLIEAAGRVAEVSGPELVAVSRERFRRRLPGREV